jgi:hypothetical protein
MSSPDFNLISRNEIGPPEPGVRPESNYLLVIVTLHYLNLLVKVALTR